MKDKKFLIISILLMIEAVLGATYAFTHCKDGAANFFHALMLPAIELSQLLRNMSLSGGVGNFLAFVIYIAVCSIPLLTLAFLLIKRRAEIADLMLIIISVMAFIITYWGINPSTMPIISEMVNARGNLEGYIATLASVIIAYVIIRIVGTFEKVKEEKMYMALRGLCVAVMIIAVAKIFGDNLLTMLGKFYAQNITPDNSKTNVLITKGILVMQYVMEQIPFIYLIAVAKIGWDGVPDMKESAINAELKKKLIMLVKVSKVYLVCVGLSQVLINFIQIAAGESNNVVDIHATIPIGTIIMAIVLMVMAKMIDLGTQLKEENDLFI